MLTINVCIGSACHVKGSYKVIEELKNYIDQKGLNSTIEIKGNFCLGHCTEAVSVQFDNEFYSVSPEETISFIEKQVMPKCNY